MDAKQLARITLRVIELNQQYRKTRATEKLRECERAEEEARKVCAEILHPPQRPPTLFEQIDNDAG